MTISYTHGDSLYLNLTNRCSNRCTFCVRTQADGYYADDLWLEREPTVDEVLTDLKSRDLSRFSSLVFCGYGEPTERLDEMLAVCAAVRQTSAIPIRVNTNGQSDLIHGCRTAPRFAGLLDTVSISLNAPTAAGYQAICRSVYGEAAFEAILRFASDVKDFVPSVVFSIVRGTIPDEALDDCRAIADRIGVPLRIRDYIGKQP